MIAFSVIQMWPPLFSWTHPDVIMNLLQLPLLPLLLFLLLLLLLSLLLGGIYCKHPAISFTKFLMKTIFEIF